MKILFVDDDRAATRAFIDYFMLIEDWDVVLATSPASALAKIRADPKVFDLILLDIMMPPDDAISGEESEMGLSTGLLLLDKLVVETAGSVPIVLLTARQDLEASQWEGKALLYLRKTMTIEEIVDLLRATLK